MRETIVIDNSIIKAKKTGDKYLAVKSDKGWFNCFDHDVAEALENLRGAVSVEYTQKGNFKNITSFEMPLGEVKTTAPKYDNQRLIVRQSCLKAAVGFYENKRSAEQFDIKEVIKAAEEFENWVFR